MHVYGVQCAPSLFHRQPIIFTLKDIVVTPNKPLILLWWSMLYYSLGVHCAIVVCDLVRSICSVSASLICLLHMIVCQTWAKGYPIGISISFSLSLSLCVHIYRDPYDAVRSNASYRGIQFTYMFIWMCSRYRLHHAIHSSHRLEINVHQNCCCWSKNGLHIKQYILYLRVKLSMRCECVSSSVDGSTGSTTTAWEKVNR